MLGASRAPVRRLTWATDIHLNFLSHVGMDAFCDGLRREEPDAVLVTGDIAEAPTLEPLLSLVAAEMKVPIYFVLGNHDYYRASSSSSRAWRSWASTGGRTGGLATTRGRR